MTYYVSSGTLNPTHSLTPIIRRYTSVGLLLLYSVLVLACAVGADVRQRLLAGDSSSLKDNDDMVKTIAIAVCSAVAYLAIIIGLTVYCSIRLVRAAALRKHPPTEAAVHGQSPVLMKRHACQNEIPPQRKTFFVSIRRSTFVFMWRKGWGYAYGRG